MASTFLHNFIMQGLRDAVGKLADYAVILNAVGWMEKGVLVEADLVEIQELIDEKNMQEPNVIAPANVEV